MNDFYCERCDVFGHLEGSMECEQHYQTVELPYIEEKRAQIGEIRRLVDDLEMFDEGGHLVWCPSGTLVRLTDWTPSSKGRSHGHCWTIATLDGRLGTPQVFSHELEELNAIERLATLDDLNSMNRDPSP